MHGDEYLTPAEVGEVFRVSPKTVARWADQGMLTCMRTLGGNRRYRRSDVEALLAQQQNTEKHP